MTKVWLACFGLFSAALAHAQETETTGDIDVPSPWNSEVEFGYQAHSGNSESESLNSRIDAEYIRGRHRTNGEWKFYLLYKDGEEDKRQSSYSLQTDYKLSPKTYLYGSFSGIDSRYSAYYRDYTFSGGVGYQFTNTDTLLLEVEIGPGYRYQEPNLDEIDDDDIVFPDIVEEAIFRGKVNSKWQVVDNLALGATFTLVSGHSNTRIDTDLNATNAITEDIALKLAYSRQYHDRVPEGLQNSDSIFSVNLLFAF
ncbi:YdiY family protein [Vibrio taketomensis]|uniref:DUF481 domain-containing protein n=1 Tax=Vibrio taketomensis TaxID=2572923 RepID=UPI0015770FCB|nr:DUF481 domain-containing protein [Vibrio taketomensis]